MDHRRNKTENQAILGDKWKWKHSHPKPIGCTRWKATVTQSHLRKGGKSQTWENHDVILKGLEKEQAKLRVSRREETKKIRTKINEIERKKMIGGKKKKTQWKLKWFF